MIKAVLILPDGREISSGDPQAPGISAFCYTHRVNDEGALDLGCACAGQIEVTVLHREPLPIAPGMAIRCCYQGQSRVLLGQFLVDTVEAGSNCTRITAYDRMTLLDVDLTGFLASLTGWPYTVNQLLSMVCSQCGVECAPDMELIHGDHLVPRFLGAVTGRQLIRWIAGANAAFAIMTPEGKLTFRFYQRESLTLPVASASLSAPIAPIERVVIRQEEQDLGVSYPENGEAYTVTGNPMLVSDPEMAAKGLLQRLEGFSYSPGKVAFFDPEGLCRPGMLLQVGSSTVAVFSVVQRGGISTVECTGPATSQSPAAINKVQPLTAVQGKLLRLQMDVSGLSAEAEQRKLDLQTLEKETAALSLSASGILARVESTEQQIQTKASAAEVTEVKSTVTTLQQKADGLALSVQTISGSVAGKADKEDLTEVTEHFRFASDGMTISNTATGMGINVSQQQVAFIGGQNPTTIIRPNDMETTNLQVKTQLDLGGFSFIPRTNHNLSLRWTGGNT